MNKFLKIGVLLVAEIVAMVIAYNIQQSIEYRDSDDYDYEEFEKNKNYEEKEFRADEWNYEAPMRKAVYYLPENRIVREWDVHNSGYDKEVLSCAMNGYAIIDDGKEANIFDPEGKPVFEEDIKDGLLVFVYHDQLVCNRMTGDYYDLQGQSVTNIHTIIDWLDFKYPDAFYLSIFAFFFILTFLLWYFLLWRKKKAQPFVVQESSDEDGTILS